MTWLAVLLAVGLCHSVLSQDTLPAEEEPLVRCKRPMCRQECEMGFQTDSLGCPVCRCLEDPCLNIRSGIDCPMDTGCKAKECTEHPCTELQFKCVGSSEWACPMPMCATRCEHGYAKDEQGCMTCKCKPLTCETKECPEHQRCRMHMPCAASEKCDMVPTCISDDGHYPKPQTDCPPPPVCEVDLACEFGYKKDERGCGTCDCNTDPCDEHECIAGSVCEAKMDEDLCEEEDENCPIVPTCKARPLCHEARDMWEMMRSMPDMGMMRGMHHRQSMHMMGHDSTVQKPMCDEMGRFMPRQCHEKLGHCWCVDDRGLEIDGTRAPRDSVNCAYNRTVGLDLRMMMHHELNNVEEHLEELEGMMKEHFSKWMMIDQKWITVVKISPQEHQVKVILIHIVVIHDGETDLPSAANFLRRQVHHGQCNVPYQGQVLTPQPDSMRIHHKFEMQPPEVPEEPIHEEWDNVSPTPTTCWGRAKGFYRNHRLPVIVGGVGLILLLAVLIGVTVAVIKKRKMASYQFRHRRLENMENFKKNLVLSSEMEFTIDPVTGEKKEKAPVSETDVVVTPTEEKVALA